MNDVQEDKVGTFTGSKFFKLSGYISRLTNDDKVYYLACPDCRKKVIEQTEGWRCESCDKVKPTMVPTYMLQGRVSDLLGNVYVSFPRELADQIMGMNAEDFKAYKESHTVEEIKELFNNR